MSRTTFVLLPPSESKEPGGRLGATPGFFDDVLAMQREEVARALARTMTGASLDGAAKIFNARGAILERAKVSTRQILEGSAPLLAAWQRYNGVVWSHLDPASLDDKQRGRILVPSGLYGLSIGTDPIADFRLTMKVSLDRLGNLATFWRPMLIRVLEDMPDARLVSLLPKEHSVAIGPSDVLATKLVKVTFVRFGGEGVAGHDAKAVKGVVARRILEDGLDAVDGFRWKGWRGRFHDGQYEIRAPRHGPK